jgi:hypothetical protein
MTEATWRDEDLYTDDAGRRLGLRRDGKSRTRFAGKRGGVFSLYTIPLRHLLKDAWLWQPLGRAVPSPTARFPRRRASASVTHGPGR